ncbi:MAG: type II toxin-antitoxin system HipA family toxin [Enhygromyxa sp.]
MSERVDVVLDDASLGPTTKIGTLHRERGRSAEVISFAYEDDYLALPGAVAIDPELQLHPGRMYPTQQGGLFGIFRDTAPDRWGRVLMERREALDAKQQKRRRRRLSEWDFLVGVSDVARLGALRLCETEPPHRYLDDRDHTVPPFARLRELEAIARELSREGVEERPEYAQWLAQLIQPGTSLGGARPKATFCGEDGQLWLAKFPAHDDRRDVGAWEHFAGQLALTAGIHMPESRLLDLGSRYRTHALKRFDREPGSRRLYASAMTLLELSDGAEGSYLDIAEAIQLHGDPALIAADLEQLYGRIVFSILISNRDDHFRNHGFLRTAGGWRLSPAFDINPNPDKLEHALAIDEADPSPSIANLHATHRYYRLTDTQASNIEVQVRAAVRGWRQIASKVGVSAVEQRLLADIVDPDAD